MMITASPLMLFAWPVISAAVFLGLAWLHLRYNLKKSRCKE
jgi:hypothetical protein